jgi:vancomycin resistance protein YoaR
LDEVTRSGERPARDASITIVDGNVVIGDDVDGRVLDRKATLETLRPSLLSSDNIATSGNALEAVRIPTTWSTTPATLQAKDLEPVAQQTQTDLARGLVLVAGSERYAISPGDLGDAIRFTRDDGRWSAQLDPSNVADLVGRANRSFARPHVRARFTLTNGVLKLASPVEPARSIDEKAAVRAVLDGWHGGEVSLPVVVTPSPVDDAFMAKAARDLRGVIGEASTSYAGSIRDRAHNVELAAHNLDGTLIAPGESFSFNDAVGPTTLDAGFRWGFAIQGGNAGPTTIPSVAGGICQVATTVFQPVFWAGYQIDEHHWHDYWIERYRTRGYPGLDATVDPDAGLDLKFTNDTGSYLLLHVWGDGQTLHAQLIGTKPTWRVDVSQPRLSDWVAAPTQVSRTTSSDFSSGTTIVTEARADGFKVAIDRTVTYPNGRSRTMNLREQYAPVGTAILMGTGS